MHNADTNDIAKPTELLNSVRAIMNVLQSIENYGKRVLILGDSMCGDICSDSNGSISVYIALWRKNALCISVHIDIARVFNNVLPQQTQPTDSFSGDKTITSNYTQWSVALWQWV